MPTIIMLNTPKRAIRLPVKKAGTNMPMTWTKMVIGASVALRPHITMASGEAAMTKDITPKAITAPAQATI